MSIPPYTIGVCSWSLQVKSIPELKTFLDKLGVNLCQIACGDPHHASWSEGDAMPKAALAAGFTMGSAMLGFPGEDYTSPQTIEKTGGFGDPATRRERLETLKWGLDRTLALGLTDLTLHAGFIPEVGAPERKAFLDTLGNASRLAAEKGITIAFESGQETAALLRRTLDDLKCPNLKVNFDPANLILYDKDDPIEALEVLAADIRSVHVKDAIRTKVPGAWGEEAPLGKGQVDVKRFVQTLKKVGYAGPLYVEREVGDQQQRFNDIASGVEMLRAILEGEEKGSGVVLS